MNIIFLTVARITDISERNIYSDLMRKFRDEGHNVFVVSPVERRFRENTRIVYQEGVTILNVKTLNQTKTNYIEKGLGLLLIERQFLRAITKYLRARKFDLVIYTTPPITLTGVVKYIKSTSRAKSYLLLKDLFPQNAVDLELFPKNGLLHRYFRKKECELYDISDHIGCMSMANLEYILNNNSRVSKCKVEVNPNSIEPSYKAMEIQRRIELRNIYGIPLHSTAFIYGGNIGVPQGIDFLLEVLESNRNNKNVFFVIAGDGTEYPRVSAWKKEVKAKNVLILPSLLRSIYNDLVQTCDVGLIFLDHRFTIPNYPSRLLTYLEYKKPILAATDNSTDIGKDAESMGYGFWTPSNDVKTFNAQIDKFSQNPQLASSMGERGYNYLIENFTVSNSYKIIMNHFEKEPNHYLHVD